MNKIEKIAFFRKKKACKETNEPTQLRCPRKALLGKKFPISKTIEQKNRGILNKEKAEEYETILSYPNKKDYNL